MDYQTSKYKDAINLARSIICLKKGGGLDGIETTNLTLNETAYRPQIHKWCRLCSYQMNTNRESTKEHLVHATTMWVRNASIGGADAAFVIARDKKGDTALLYSDNNTVVESVFHANVSQSDLQCATLDTARYNHQGVFTGTFSAEGLADAVLLSRQKNFAVALILLSVADAEVDNLITTDQQFMNQLENYRNYHRVYGKASRYEENVSIPSVEQAFNILEQEIRYLQENAGRGFVRAIVRYGAGTQQAYMELSSVIRSSMRQNGGGFEPLRQFHIATDHMRGGDLLAVPTVQVPHADYSIHPLTLQTVDAAASFCMPPMISCNGVCVRNYSVDEDDIELYPQPEHISVDKAIILGKGIDTGADVAIQLDLLQKHCFVSGSTGSGKSTTIVRILHELYARNKLPFCVLEAAKREYAQHFVHIPELRVYTSGANGLALTINPLQPENGVLIENHVDAVVRALVTATGGEHPIPEAYHGLLKQTYEQFGWHYGMMAYQDERHPFPTFGDVLARIPDYISCHAQYGPEVRQNMTAALSLRTETMDSGALGRLFSSNAGLQARDFLESPCIIELADFSEESTTFLMSILLFKLQSYLADQESTRLQRILVVEEAHNIYRQPEAGSYDQYGRSLNNDAFDKMLAEIRSSGTGLILCDQRPSIMSDAAIANTSVRIMHAMAYQRDCEVMATASNMSSFQTQMLHELGVGECLVSVTGAYGLQHVKITPVYGSTEFGQAACYVCLHRMRCRRNAVRAIIRETDSSMVEYHLSRIIANPYNVPVLEQCIDDMLQDLNITAAAGTRLCLLGELLASQGNVPVQKARLIITAYRNYLNREVS